MTMTNIFTHDAPGIFSDICIHIVLQSALKIMHCEQVFQYGIRSKHCEIFSSGMFDINAL